MIKAILLDLDDTLLKNPNQGFVPRYMELIDSFFTQHFGTNISKTLIRSVRLMSGERDMQHTNLHLALTLISEATGQPVDTLEATIHQFYTDVYPELESQTHRVNGAVSLVQDLQAQGYQVAIATNPVYPGEAIRQRLAWAGLSDDFDDYAFVTRADNMHFAKPNPAYYAEILGRIGVEPDEAIMVGDNFENDIQAAATIGMHTCHVESGDLSSFVEQIPLLDSWLPPLLHPESIEPQFRGNIGALFGLVTNIKPHFWTQHPEANEWSPQQIVCHLLERESSVHRARIEQILAKDNPFIIDPGAPTSPPDMCDGCEDDGLVVTQRFLEQRQTTIAVIQPLTPADWERTAHHSIFGPTTLLEMAHFTAQHDRLHLKQLCRTIGKCE